MENLFIGINIFNLFFIDFIIILLFCVFIEVYKKIIIYWLFSLEEKICFDSYFIVVSL